MTRAGARLDRLVRGSSTAGVAGRDVEAGRGARPAVVRPAAPPGFALAFAPWRTGGAEARWATADDVDGPGPEPAPATAPHAAPTAPTAAVDGISEDAVRRVDEGPRAAGRAEERADGRPPLHDREPATRRQGTASSQAEAPRAPIPARRVVARLDALAPPATPSSPAGKPPAGAAPSTDADTGRRSLTAPTTPEPRAVARAVTGAGGPLAGASLGRARGEAGREPRAAPPSGEGTERVAGPRPREGAREAGVPPTAGSARAVVRALRPVVSAGEGAAAASASSRPTAPAADRALAEPPVGAPPRSAPRSTHRLDRDAPTATPPHAPRATPVARAPGAADPHPRAAPPAPRPLVAHARPRPAAPVPALAWSRPASGAPSRVDVRIGTIEIRTSSTASARREPRRVAPRGHAAPLPEPR